MHTAQLQPPIILQLGYSWLDVWGDHTHFRLEEEERQREGGREREIERERERESLPFHSSQWDGRYTNIFIVVQEHKVSGLCKLPGKTANRLKVSSTPSVLHLALPAWAGLVRLNMEPIAWMHACMYVCVCVCVQAGLKGELLHLCSSPLSFLVKFFFFLQLSPTLGFIHFGGPVITAKSNTFKNDCASDGSRGMCSERRLYALKHWWPRPLFWRFTCAS